MYEQVIDSHIHIDQYCRSDREKIMNDLNTYNIKALIAVSTHLKSSYDILSIASKYNKIRPALGFHPEQPLPEQSEVDELINLIKNNQHNICAIGEVGLPYYLKEDKTISSNKEYIELLEQFIKLAQQLNKPLALHAVYDDAPVVCDLLEKYSIAKAHFHWFKGDSKTIERMTRNKYHISITPDVLYETDIIQLVEIYPLHLIMVETDGPWAFDGPFKDKMTHPYMIHDIIKKISEIKRLSYKEVANVIYKTTVDFYKLDIWLNVKKINIYFDLIKFY